MSNENAYDDVPTAPGQSLAFGCSHCCSLPPPDPVCPTVEFEGKSGYGSASRPGPCGFYNPDDGNYYLTTTTTTWKAVRDVASPCHQYTCELWFDGLQFRIVKSTDVPEDFTYDSLVVSSYTLDENCACGDVSVDATTAMYTLNHRINNQYAGPLLVGCTTAVSGSVPAGCYLQELDPDASGSTTEYSDLWTCAFDVEAAAFAAMTTDFAAAIWGEGGWSSSATVYADETGDITSAYIDKSSIRAHITGGNTGYVKIDWEVRDQDYALVNSGSVIHEWTPDPEAPLDVTIDIITLLVDWPTVIADSSASASLSFEVVSVTCVPA